MKARLIFALLLLANMIATQAESFRYPTMPDSLKSADERASYLLIHYWDCFNFSDTLQLKDADNVEQGFVNYVDLLSRLSAQVRDGHLRLTTDSTLQQSVGIFSGKAFATAPAKKKFESLIDHYLDDPQSPMRNDRTYLLFLQQMKASSHFDETEKERVAFKIKTRDKNLPGDMATNFTFADKDGKQHELKDYKGEKVILYFYDPECENCHRISAWLAQQTIPPTFTILTVHADDKISDLYSLEAMPTIYLLDKGNTVVLKDCSAELMVQVVNSWKE